MYMPLTDDKGGKTLPHVVILEELIQDQQVCEKLEGKYLHLSRNALFTQKKKKSVFAQQLLAASIKKIRKNNSYSLKKKK